MYIPYKPLPAPQPTHVVPLTIWPFTWYPPYVPNVTTTTTTGTVRVTVTTPCDCNKPDALRPSEV